MKPTLVKKTRFNLWVWRNFPHCSEIVKMITARMEGNLSFFDTMRMKIHLLSCPPCENFLNHLVFLSSTLRDKFETYNMENSSVKLSGSAQLRLKRALENAINQTES